MIKTAYLHVKHPSLLSTSRAALAEIIGQTYQSWPNKLAPVRQNTMSRSVCWMKTISLQCTGLIQTMDYLRSNMSVTFIVMTLGNTINVISQREAVSFSVVLDSFKASTMISNLRQDNRSCLLFYDPSLKTSYSVIPITPGASCQCLELRAF